MEKEYHKYAYEGPVSMFDTCVCNKWYGETIAPSEKKARSNLSYQYKKQTGYAGRSKVTLPGKIEMVE